MFSRAFLLTLVFSLLAFSSTARDTVYHSYHVIIKEIDSFDHFYLVKAYDMSQKIELAVFSLRKEPVNTEQNLIKVGDTLKLCLYAPTLLYIAPGYPISYHPNTSWKYQNKIVTERDQAPFISSSLYNLAYVRMDCKEW